MLVGEDAVSGQLREDREGTSVPSRVLLCFGIGQDEVADLVVLANSMNGIGAIVHYNVDPRTEQLRNRPIPKPRPRLGVYSQEAVPFATSNYASVLRVVRSIPKLIQRNGRTR